MALRYYIQAGGQQVICSWKSGPWMQKKIGKNYTKPWQIFMWPPDDFKGGLPGPSCLSDSRSKRLMHYDHYNFSLVKCNYPRAVKRHSSGTNK